MWLNKASPTCSTLIVEFYWVCFSQIKVDLIFDFGRFHQMLHVLSNYIDYCHMQHFDIMNKLALSMYFLVISGCKSYESGTDMLAMKAQHATSLRIFDTSPTYCCVFHIGSNGCENQRCLKLSEMVRVADKRKSSSQKTLLLNYQCYHLWS